MATAVDSLEQNQNLTTRRPDSQTGFFIEKNPTSQIGTGYTYSDSVLKPRESTAVHWPRFFEHWHLLSLDAPTIAALWSWFFARAMHIDLPWHAPLLLALGTWLVYVADRILDGFQPNPTAPLRQRHLFHARHRRLFLAAAVAAAGLLIWLIFGRMTANVRHEDTILFAVAMLYFFLVHKPGPGSKHWLPKELVVGAVFAAATAVPAWSRLDIGRAALFPAVVVFAALCWLNCVAIERWENLSPNGELQSPGAHQSTRWTARHLSSGAMALATLSGLIATALMLGLGSEHYRKTILIYLATLTAALVLALADRHRDDFSQLHLRIAADLALLTPLIFMPFLL